MWDVYVLGEEVGESILRMTQINVKVGASIKSNKGGFGDLVILQRFQARYADIGLDWLIDSLFRDEDSMFRNAISDAIVMPVGGFGISRKLIGPWAG